MMATGTKVQEVADPTRAAVDNATATDSVALAGTPDPRAPKSPAPDAGRVVLLPASRQNGAFDGGVHDLGEGEQHSLSIEMNVLNLFGGADSNVQLDGRVLTRTDATEDWYEAASFRDIRTVGSRSATAKCRRQVMFAGSVSGTAGGHAVQLEVIATR